MELLAPAGSFAAFDAALSEGADAVYLGAPLLNARALARDFTFEEISAMIQYAHRQKAKVYIAMNSLVKESEIPTAVESLARFEAFGADALIVQDIGLLPLAAVHCPNLRLHASTLMTVHNSPAVRSLIRLGFKRIVLPRELTVQEIGMIFANTEAELEVFVHGAMCFSYSGLCLFSSLHGGKSSLRGQCVQPCRRRYSWLRKKSPQPIRQAAGKGGGYLFSMNDLSAIDLLPELARAGVRSLKIEGRLKSAEYVRKTVRAYRLVLDSIASPGTDMRAVRQEARQLLDEAMGRRRSTGFFLNSRPGEAVTPHLSGNVGTMVGRVNALEIRSAPGVSPGAMLTVSLRQPVRAGDRLRLHNEQTGERTAFTLHAMWLERKRVQQAGRGKTVHMEARQQFSGKATKKFQGTLFRVDIGSGRQDEKKIREKILRHRPGSIPPAGQNVSSVTGGSADALAVVGNALHGEKLSPAPGGPPPGAADRPEWWVKVRRFSDIHFRLPVVPSRYVVPVNEENIAPGLKYFSRNYTTVIWCLPPVILDDKLAWYSGAVESLIRSKYTQFLVSHFTHSALFEGKAVDGQSLRIYGSHTTNALNSLTLGQLRRMGLSGTIFSIETDRENLVQSLNDFRQLRQDFKVGMYVYGRPPLFTARLDGEHFEYGKRFVSPKMEEYLLSREDDLTYAKSAVPFSLLAEWQSLLRMGVDFLFVDLGAGNMKRNATEFIAHYHHRSDHPPGMTGNYFDLLV